MSAATQFVSYDRDDDARGRLRVHLPLRLVSENNAHEHWRVRQKRAKHQRAIAAVAARCPWWDQRAPLVVTITRIAPRALDDDNLAGSGKHVRDGVADALKLPNDRDPRVSWRYAQERCGTGVYGVRIVIERAP